jgi:glutamate/tyrosine decarboxylase-like PLP-dependent enzyme
MKSLFLGPQSENAEWFSARVSHLLQHYFSWRKRLFPQDGQAITIQDINEPKYVELRERMVSALAELLVEIERETPKFTPRYIGHMVSEVSLPALLGEFAMLLHNPNNACRDVAKVGVILEVQGIQALATMIGYDPTKARGHFTSGGTVANFEAIWRARYQLDRRMTVALALIRKGLEPQERFLDLCHSDPFCVNQTIAKHRLQNAELSELSVLSNGPWSVEIDSILGSKFYGPVMLVPGNKHYSWPKACAAFGLGERALWPIALDRDGRLDLSDLETKIADATMQNRPIVGIVSVAGTTELGEFDPVDLVQDKIDRYRLNNNWHLWHHVDAAYGGYFACLRSHEAETAPAYLSPGVVNALRAFARVDSITIDPHKLGYVPYACGAFLTRTRELYQTYQVSAPYLSTNPATSDWATTLEGSRSAAGAAAVWLTSKTLPYDASGFGHILEKTLAAQREFKSILSAEIPEVKLVTPIDTNILCFSVAFNGESLEDANRRVNRIFEAIEVSPEFSVSRTSLARSSYRQMISRLATEWQLNDDGLSDLNVIRLVLMNPFIMAKEMHTEFAHYFARYLRDLVHP